MITSIRSLASERRRRREQRIRQLEQERDAREYAVFRCVPRLAEIKAVQSDIGLDLARLVLRVPTKFGKGFEELKEWSAELSKERAGLLATHHIDPRELEVWWDCGDCKNTGWLPPEQIGPETVHPAQKCHCLIQEEIDDMYRSAGLTGPLREQTFDRFDLTVYPMEDRGYMSKLAEFCKDFADRAAAGNQDRGLLLTGDVGRGKTFLASAVADVVVRAKRTVVYFTLSEFLDLIRLQKFDDENEYREGIQRLLDADLIVLDDLGAEKITEFVGQELFNLVNHRMNRRLPIVISTNLRPEEIGETYGQRLHSRLVYGFDVLALKGGDVRKILVMRQRR